MSTVNRRPGWRAVLAVLALTGAPTLVTVSTAAPAQARCNGVNTPVTMVLRNSAGQTIAREIPTSGTCNGNKYYQGAVEDSRTDGSCARLTIFNSSAGGYIDDVTECTTGGRTSFALQHGDGSMWFELSADGWVVGRSNFGY